MPQPNILFFHVDNLGFGELSCYSGGPFRGTWTRRIDAFAGEGTRLRNYAPEAPCTPTRSALLPRRPGAPRPGGRCWPGGTRSVGARTACRWAPLGGGG